MEKEWIQDIVETTRKAGKAIMEIYRKGDFAIDFKSDHSPLTQADRASHEIIEKGLIKFGLPILSEEGRNVPYETRKNWQDFWLVDPLDGTKEFIKRNDEFTVNIALIQNGCPTWGIVYAPALGKLYYCNEEGKVVMKEETNEQIISTELKPRTEPTTFIQEGLRVVASRSHIDDRTQSFLNGLKSPKVVSMGSSLKFMMLAEGKADVYPRFAPTMEWDTAAAHGILNALEIKVLQADLQQLLSYNKEDLVNPHFVCC
jgi:3'(2'), 5'-bisphosphate nucleotidase